MALARSHLVRRRSHLVLTHSALPCALLQTYVNNVNAALDKFPELKTLGIVDLNKVRAWEA